jgi:hypothetical protein
MTVQTLTTGGVDSLLTLIGKLGQVPVCDGFVMRMAGR